MRCSCGQCTCDTMKLGKTCSSHLWARRPGEQTVGTQSAQIWCRMGGSHFGCVLFLTALRVVPALTRLWLGGPDSSGYGPRRSRCGWTLVQKDLKPNRSSVPALENVLLPSALRGRPCQLPDVAGGTAGALQRGDGGEPLPWLTEQRAQRQREALSEGRAAGTPVEDGDLRAPLWDLLPYWCLHSN